MGAARRRGVKPHTVSDLDDSYDLVGEGICCRYCAKKWRAPADHVINDQNWTFLAEHLAQHRANGQRDLDDDIPF